MNQKGFSQVILLGIVVVVLVGVGGFLILREKKAPSSGNEKTVQQELSSENVTSPIEPTPSPAQSIQPQNPKTQPEETKKVETPQTQEYEVQTRQFRDPWRDPLPLAPTNLVLPFALKDIQKAGGLISPYGPVRHSRDTEIGHGGIDFPLEPGAPIYTAVDGTIRKSEKEDNRGGSTVDVLILPDGFLGEGWIFKYEHITLWPGLTIGSKVQKGQKIGINALQQKENNHIGLEYHIKNFTVARTKTCWVDLLGPTARQQLEDEFNQIKKTQAFLESWQTANEEGYYQYKGLLDKTKYPDGPQLCYRLGIDARIPIN